MTKVYVTLSNLDAILSEWGVKYIFVESGAAAIREKCEEMELTLPEYTTATHWCELSWGSGDDKYDFAYNEFGQSLGEAIGNCLNAFQADVRDQKPSRVAAAKDAGIYEKLIA